MHRVVKITVLTLGVAALSLVSSSAAIAAPANSPSRLVGTADCGPDGTFDFLVNSGRANANTWGPAFLTSSDGARGLFTPSSFDLTFSSPSGDDVLVASKGSVSGPVSCEISATPFPGATLSGTVTGVIVWTG